eukprot:GFUD01030181.1.p1 GENE.GFUD01030181.1~~GFUD01030181.1.p1  ORF type:complete len:244 (+),score=47.55 GFUD01030181.1:423-1154(+)
MSYYRYITGVYKSYWPELNRPLRSSSVPRHIPQAVPSRNSRASSVPASEFYSNRYFNRGTSATPFRERALSVPRQLSYSYDTRCIVSPPPATHYSDFDYKVMDYMGRLDREETVRSTVSQSRLQRTSTRSYPADSFSSRYNYYDGNKHSGDYLYPITNDVLGSWKHYNLSADTLNYRNMRSKSPLVTRELNRYYEKKSNYIGDLSSGGTTDFRHYNYRRVPYFGGSDGYQFMKTKPFQGGRGF